MNETGVILFDIYTIILWKQEKKKAKMIFRLLITQNWMSKQNLNCKKKKSVWTIQNIMLMSVILFVWFLELEATIIMNFGQWTSST